MSGYAVVDVETTGLRPSWHDRIVEIAVVQVAANGEVESTWATLVNPERDLGPQEVHGISAADILHAPTFDQVAGTLSTLLRGRAFVAHNASFDLGFLRWSYNALGYDVPLVPPAAICTMQWAHHLLPGAPRTLAGCCQHAGIDRGTAHEALSDAMAAAALLKHYLHAAGMPRTDAPRRRSLFRSARPTWQAPWADAIELAGSAQWPPLPMHAVEPVRRGVAAERHVPFLMRLVDQLPAAASSDAHDQYLSLIDRALLDRHLSAREHEALEQAAADLGIDRPAALTLHRAYLGDLARSAMADGVLTNDEVTDLHAVAALLGLPETEVDVALEEVAGASEGAEPTERFKLSPGDMVVFTGDMRLTRQEWIERASAAGLVPHPGVTKKVALVVAADPDSLSGKARKAADYGIPIVTEDAFASMLDDMRTTRMS